MRNLILTSAAVLALNGAAMAQTMTPKPATPPPAKTASPGRKPMTAQSEACSTQADAKGLHGADREKFRRACLKRT